MIKRKGERINKGIVCTSKGVRKKVRLDNINSLIINGINYPKECESKKYIPVSKNDGSKRLKFNILWKNNKKIKLKERPDQLIEKIIEEFKFETPKKLPKICSLISGYFSKIA